MPKGGNASAAKDKSRLDITERSAELSAVLYFELVKKGYLDASHLQMAKNIGKFALALNVAKQLQITFFDAETTLLEQATEIVIDEIVTRLPTSSFVAVKAVELAGCYIAPVIIDEVEAAVSHIAQTEQDILAHFSEAERVALQSEFTLSEEMQAAVAWVRGVKYLAEKSGQAKKWVGKKVQDGAEALEQIMKKASAETKNEELAEEYQEAAGIFTLIGMLSEKIKKKRIEDKIEEVVEQTYSLYSEGLIDEPVDEASAGSSVGGDRFFKSDRQRTLDPKFSISISGGTTAGLAVIGKVSMNLSGASFGIGIGFFAACSGISLILNNIRKKKFKKCEKHHQANLADVYELNGHYEQLIEKYKSLYDIAEITSFCEGLEGLGKEIESVVQEIQAKQENLNNRNKRIQTELPRKDYKKGYRQAFDEMRAFYGNIESLLQQMAREISENLTLLNTDKPGLKM